MQLDCWEFTHSPVCLHKGDKSLEKQQMAESPKPALERDLRYCAPVCTLLHSRFAAGHTAPPSESCRKVLTP